MSTEDSDEVETFTAKLPFAKGPMDFCRMYIYLVEAIISVKDILDVTVSTVLDTGTVPNLFNEYWLPKRWMYMVTATALPRLRPAVKYSMRVGNSFSRT